MKDHRLRLEKAWHKGYIHIKNTAQVKNWQKYITKYMKKDLWDTRLDNHRCYYPSIGLKRPVVVYSKNAIDEMMKVIPPLSLKNDYIPEYKELSYTDVQPVNKFSDKFRIVRYRKYDVSSFYDIKRRLIDMIELMGAEYSVFRLSEAFNSSGAIPDF
jgi:hypothetical protein